MEPLLHDEISPQSSSSRFETVAHEDDIEKLVPALAQSPQTLARESAPFDYDALCALEALDDFEPGTGGAAQVQLRFTPAGIFDTGRAAGSAHSGATATASPSNGKETFQRASRLARPAEPDQGAMQNAYDIIMAKKQELLSAGLILVTGDVVKTKNVSSAGKGPALRAESDDMQNRVNHLASIKSKHVDSSNRDPEYIVGLYCSVPMMYSRLACCGLRANAVNSSLIQRERTHGAASQTSRFNTKTISQAASAQIVAVATAMAHALALAKHNLTDVCVRSPMCSNGTNPCTLWMLEESCVEPIVFNTTSHLVFNANPAKIGITNIMASARLLARAELRDHAISDRIATVNSMLTTLCVSITNPGDYIADAVWAAFVLIVYLLSHPEGRVILRDTSLTDVDFQTAVAFESYGRSELTRRARYETNQNADSKRKKSKGKGKQSTLDPVLPPLTPVPSIASMFSASQATPSRESEASHDTSDAFELHEAERHTASQRVLATKRKRGSKGSAATSTTDSAGLLCWWSDALVCENRSVIESLVSESVSAAKAAAGATLKRQAGDMGAAAANSVILGISEQNAVRSAQAIVKTFVGRKQRDMPILVSWKWQGRSFVGVSRTPDEASSTALHACMLNDVARADSDTRLVVAWSDASMKLTGSGSDTFTLPGMLEKLHYAQKQRTKGGKRSENVAERIEEQLRSSSDKAKKLGDSGLTRSTISFFTQIRAHNSQLAQGHAFFDELKACAETNKQSGGDDDEPCVANTSQSLARGEPLCTPVSPLVIGIVMCEELRTWLVGKTRKNDPAKVVTSPIAMPELKKEGPQTIDVEPPPVLVITDFNLDVDIGPEEDHPTRSASSAAAPGTTLLNVSVALHVCGDGVIRLPEAIRLLWQSVENSSEVLRFCLHARQLVWAGATQSSFTGDVGVAITACHANSAISSSKKISVADYHRAPLLTCYDAYVGGLANLEPNCQGSAHVGVYGCTIDSGISPPGINAQNYRSDRRQHGNVALGQDAANELCRRMAHEHFVRCDDGAHFCERPYQTHGMPHNLVPGVHACTGSYADALRCVREASGRDEDTVLGVMSLPFGPWSQAIPPLIENSLDLSTRLCVRDPDYLSYNADKAFLPDVSSYDDAIVREPLFRRPHCVVVTDNPFNTSLQNAEVFFSAASNIALLAKHAAIAAGADDATAHMHELITMWVTGDGPQPPTAVFAADALVALSVMYPATWAVSELVVPEVWARAVPALLTYCHTSASDGTCGLPPLKQLVSPELCVAGRKWWSAFCRRGEESGAWCAWQNGVGPLIRLLVKHDGSHYVTTERRAEMREALEDAVRAAWAVASPDGVDPPTEPCPLAGVESPRRVRRVHVDGTFVGNQEEGIEQRGSLIGLKQFQYRQICALAMGAGLCDDVEVQCARNEGGLNLRISSAPDVSAGKARTSKACSPVQVESDFAAYGSREDKLASCALQRRAWDTNAALLTPIFLGVLPPRPMAERGRGCVKCDDVEVQCQSHILASEDDVAARQLFSQAVSPAAERLAAKTFE